MVVPRGAVDEAVSLAQGFAFSSTVQPDVEEVDDQTVRVSLTAFFPRGERSPEQIERAFSAEMQRRFPTGYVAARAALDEQAATPEDAP